MTPEGPDPKLVAAMEEVKAILKKNDIVGVVILQSAESSEFLTQFEASWNAVKLIPDGERRVKVQVCTTDRPKEQRQELFSNSIGMVMGFQDSLRVTQENLGIIARCITQDLKGEVNHVSRRVA